MKASLTSIILTATSSPPLMPAPRLAPEIPAQVGEYPSSSPAPTATFVVQPTCQPHMGEICARNPMSIRFRDIPKVEGDDDLIV